MKLHLVAVFGALLMLAGCKPAAPVKNTLFTKINSSASNINFTNVNVENEQINIFTYEYLYNGAGVAAGDINNDGLADLYFTSNNTENRLFLNKGNLKFEDITQSAGAGCKDGWKTGTSMVDINGDGWLDIYVCKSADGNPEKRRNILLINNHDLTFTDRAKEYGLDDDSYTTQAAFFDYDRDGDLDAFMLNHSLLSISNSFNINQLHRAARYPFVGNKLLRNDHGHFTDVSDASGIFGPSSTYGLGIGISDLNNDGWPDIYVSNDYVDNDRIYLNDHEGKFTDATSSMLTHTSQFSMGNDIADINGDGAMDILSLDMLPEDNKRQKLLFGPDRYDVFNMSVKNGFYNQYMRNMLHINNGDGTFTEAGQLAGISNTDWSWSALFADYDNDGLQDLYVSNGYKRDFTNNDFLKYKADQQLKSSRGAAKEKNIEMISKMPSNRLHNYIFKNTGNLSFKNMITEWGLDEPILTNGAAYADLDNDGDLDLIMNHLDEPAAIYKNNSAVSPANSFLEIALKGNAPNTMGLGAKVTVFSNRHERTRELFTVRGFQSSVDPVLHFGLGNTDVDSIVVRWPLGNAQTLKNVSPNQRITLEEKNAGETNKKDIAPEPLFTEAKDAIAFVHHENEFVDYKVQALLPRMYSTQGPALAKGDVNGDGLEDIFAGGARGQQGEIFIQGRSGNFVKRNQGAFSAAIESESAAATFFDADGDKDLDLYVVSGGYEYQIDDPLLADHLYLNDGAGNFRTAVGALPAILSSGSCVRAADIDGDGDQDLFVGGRVVPGRYPEAPESYLLINDGKAKFSNGAAAAPMLKNIGMVTDAMWIDVNEDKLPDLVVAGEWLPITFLINHNGALKDESSMHLPVPSSGWWNCIRAADIDNDGDLDLIAGNIGMNNQMKATVQQPVTIVYSDLDKNGSVDPLINYFIEGENRPYANRDELTDQIPSLKKRFTDYESYSTATLQTILTEAELKNSQTLTANRFETSLLINDGKGVFRFGVLPLQAQVAPIFSIIAKDVNGDGFVDLVTAGNLSQARIRFGRMSGNYGFVFAGDGKGNFKWIPQTESGFHVRGDVRQMEDVGNEFVFALNNAQMTVYRRAKK